MNDLRYSFIEALLCAASKRAGVTLAREDVRAALKAGQVDVGAFFAEHPWLSERLSDMSADDVAFEKLKGMVHQLLDTSPELEARCKSLFHGHASMREAVHESASWVERCSKNVAHKFGPHWQSAAMLLIAGALVGDGARRIVSETLEANPAIEQCTSEQPGSLINSAIGFGEIVAGSGLATWFTLNLR